MIKKTFHGLEAGLFQTGAALLEVFPDGRVQVLFDNTPISSDAVFLGDVEFRPDA